MDLFLSTDEARQIRGQLQADGLLPLLLRYEADRTMKHPLYAVTDHPSPAASGDPHDYFSEGPYWWPDPAHPDGPYIRRDGEINPDRFDRHHRDLGALCRDSYLLAAAGYFLTDGSLYADRAAQLLRHFFVDPATRMNPHLSYAQAIRGKCNGRSIGIIDTCCLIMAAQGVWLLEQAGHDMGDVKDWFASYLHWLETSELGLEEKFYHNNHANWYNTQTMAYAALTGNRAVFEECVRMFRERIIPGQLNENCAFSDELTRTRSYHYCCYNLDATAGACEIAFHGGQDLYRFRTEDGRGFEGAVDFMLPYLKNPFAWRYPEIDGHISPDHGFLQLAAFRLGRADMASVSRAGRIGVYPFNWHDLGFLPLLAGYFTV